MAKNQSPAARRLLSIRPAAQSASAVGHIRGPGDATSDSIPARLSDGEFVLPADTVKKVGVKSLRNLVALTHIPTGKQERPAHFADGGLANDPGAVTRVGNSYSGMDVRGNITVNGQVPGGTYSENPGMRETLTPAPAPAPATPSVGATASPATAPAATPAATPAAAPAAVPGAQTATSSAAPAGWAERNAQRNLEVSASSILPSRARDDAQARLNAMKPPAAALMPSPATPQSGTPSLLAPPATTFGTQLVQSRPLYGTQPRQGFADGGLVTADEQRGGFQNLADRIAQIPVDGYPQAPVADGSRNNPLNSEFGRNVTNTLASLGAAAGAIPTVARTGGAISAGVNAVRNAGAGAAVGATALSTPAPAATPASAPGYGQYNHGELMGPPSEAKPSQGAVAAAAPAPARALAAGSDAYERLVAMVSGSAPEVPAVQAASIRHSGNDWAARQNLKNLETAASSIMNRPEWNSGAVINRRGQVMSGSADPNGQVAAYQQALKTDAALQLAQPEMTRAAMRENAGLQREGMQQQGASQRAVIGAQGTAEANQIARGRLALEQTTAGFQNKSAERLDAAQQELVNAKTPEQRLSASQRLLALMGKQGEGRWKGLALQGGTDASGNKTDSVLAAVNEMTGEMRRLGGNTQAAPVPAEGSRVRGPDGRVYEVKNGWPVLVGG